METTCPICRNHDDIYVSSGGMLVCRECAYRRDYRREDYIDETWCALCGYRTDGGPCPQGCPSEFPATQ